MDAKEYQLEIIERLARNEEKLSELYKLYQNKFASSSEFWKNLVLDEEGHARWIRTLRRGIEEGGVHFKEHRFNIDLINDFMTDLKVKELEIASGDIPLIQALENAVHFEATMIERKFFEVFKDDSPELEILLLALQFSTENHYKTVLQARDEEKKVIAA